VNHLCGTVCRYSRRGYAIALAVLLMVLLAAFAASPTALAQFQPATHVRAALIADHDALAAGSSATLGITLTIDAGWHVQSAKPFDPFLIPTRVTSAPLDGVTFDAPRYPAGDTIAAAPGVSSVGKISIYQDGTTILIPLHVAADATPGDRTIHLTLRVQSCNDRACLPPQRIALTLTVPIVPAGAATKSINADAFAAAGKQKLIDLSPVSQPALNATQPATVPASATTPPAIPSTAGAASESASPGSSPDVASDLALIAARNYHPAQQDEGSIGIAILLGLLGGLILNVMPCVLPVIPLKVLSLVQAAHGDRKLLALHSIAFAAGVITLFVTLGLVLHATTGIYGSQFQSPAIVLTTAMIVLAFALSMLGVWTIQTPQAAYAVDKPRGGLVGSFATGLLATVLATPCSAPFLGTTIPFALTHPAPTTALVFGVIGFGMALPYIVLAAFPQLLNRLPRAGRWTELVKEAVGIAMIGVALYLIQLAPVSTWPWALAGGIIVTYVCWAWGRIPTYNTPSGNVWAIRAGAVICGVVAAGGLWRLANRPAVTGWQPFSLAALDAGLAAGHPVVVDWTADWCINCKAVEASTLQSGDVQKAFADAGTVRLRADITNDNPVATELLDRLGSRAIPVLAVFAPARPTAPTVLRDLYSRGDVEAALTAAH
jgi:thiol:disulfide interchange protein